MERDFISIFIFALGTAGSIYIVKSIFDSVIKRNFSKSYGTGKLPRSIKVRKESNEKEKNYYYLNMEKVILRIDIWMNILYYLKVLIK